MVCVRASHAGLRERIKLKWRRPGDAPNDVSRGKQILTSNIIVISGDILMISPEFRHNWSTSDSNNTAFAGGREGDRIPTLSSNLFGYRGSLRNDHKRAYDDAIFRQFIGLRRTGLQQQREDTSR